LRGPRRPRVPLLLRAIGSSPARGGHELVREVRGNGRFEGAAKPAATRGAGDARLVAAHVRAAAVRPTTRVIANRAVGRAHDPEQLALVAAGPAVDAGSSRDCSTFEGPRGRAYDATSPAAGAWAFAFEA